VIFVTIPALLILKNLDDDDKGICKTFFPPMVGEDIQPDSEIKHPHDHHMNEEEKKTVFKKY
jgi:hypothetical protein